MRWSYVFLLSSRSARGRRLLSLLLGFASVPLSAAPAVFRGVSCHRLPFGGYATFLAPDACPAPAVGLVCGVCGVFSAALVFRLEPCSSYGACGFAQLPSRRLPFEVSAFFWPRLPALLLRWWRRLGCHPSLVFSVLLLRRLLADVRWVLQPVTGFSV